MDAPVNVPIDDPNADTEWNDILRKHGIIPEKPPSPTPILREALAEAQRQAHDNRLEGKDLDELNELEDDEDDAFLKRYRDQRLSELSTIAGKSIFNQVYYIQKPDYPRDVTEASRTAWVCVHLTSSTSGNIESRLLTELWREMAHRFGDIKFCEIKGNMCIENYPEKNTPTILIYRHGDIRKQVVTLRELGGEHVGMTDLQRLLIEVGAMGLTDHRIQRHKQREAESRDRVSRSDRSIEVKTDNHDDDDWD